MNNHTKNMICIIYFTNQSDLLLFDTSRSLSCYTHIPDQRAYHHNNTYNFDIFEWNTRHWLVTMVNLILFCMVGLVLFMSTQPITCFAPALEKWCIDDTMIVLSVICVSFYVCVVKDAKASNQINTYFQEMWERALLGMHDRPTL